MAMKKLEPFKVGKSVVVKTDDQFNGKNGKIIKAVVERGCPVIYVRFEDLDRSIMFSPKEVVVT
jgi:NurA-like 5'-3' nuclease